jgi:3'(2'), 5'-bisphosphate nucleotidase
LLADVDRAVQTGRINLTLADQAAHRVIADRFVESVLIVVSEEGEDLYLAAERYWLVDPLDGSKDFLAGNGEFTVNIALVAQGRPVLGMVFAPAIYTFFWGAMVMDAWRIRDGAAAALSAHTRSALIRIAVSRFHDNPGGDVFAARNGIAERVSIGSALKYGLLAAGEVVIFPR